jgi:hypothetical protein
VFVLSTSAIAAASSSSISLITMISSSQTTTIIISTYFPPRLTFFSPLLIASIAAFAAAEIEGDEPMQIDIVRGIARMSLIKLSQPTNNINNLLSTNIIQDQQHEFI